MYVTFVMIFVYQIILPNHTENCSIMRWREIPHRENVYRLYLLAKDIHC